MGHGPRQAGCLNAKKGDSVTPGTGLIPEFALTIKHDGQK
jgi:hypothetical protein